MKKPLLTVLLATASAVTFTNGSFTGASLEVGAGVTKSDVRNAKLNEKTKGDVAVRGSYKHVATELVISLNTDHVDLVLALDLAGSQLVTLVDGKLAPDNCLQSFHSLQLLSKQTTLRSTA